MEKKYEFDTTYRMTEKAVAEYASSRSVNGKIVRKVGSTLWSVTKLSEYGDVKELRLADSGELVSCEKLGHTGCVMFNTRELETGMVFKVTPKEEEPVREYTIMGKASSCEKFSLVRGEHDHLFTLAEAKAFVSEAIVKSPDYVYQIFSLHCVARAEKQEIKVIFE